MLIHSHQQWQEGGGDGWIGSPIYHDWIVAGVWIPEIPFREFAKKLFEEHPLGKLIWRAMEKDKWGFSIWEVYAPSGSNPREWEGVEVTKEEFIFLEEDRADGHKPGVYRQYVVNFGQWREKKILVHEPDYWEIRTAAHRTYGLWYPHVQARNGKALFRFERPNGAPAFGWEEDEKEVPQYSTELPELPSYRLPADVYGKYATFWETEEDYRAFALKWNIETHKPFMGIHEPRYNEPYYTMRPMVKGWAEIAWSEGALKIPPVVATIPANFRDWPKVPRDDYGTQKEIPKELGLKGSAYIYPEGGHWKSQILMDHSFHGWIKMPQGLKLGFGCSVRTDGDTTRDEDHELVVYEPSGFVKLPRR